MYFMERRGQRKNWSLKGVTGYVRELNWVCSVWKTSFGFIWDILNFLKICKSWVWAQIRRSKLVLSEWIRFQNRFFKLINNDDVKCKQNEFKRSFPQHCILSSITLHSRSLPLRKKINIAREEWGNLGEQLAREKWGNLGEKFAREQLGKWGEKLARNKCGKWGEKLARERKWKIRRTVSWERKWKMRSKISWERMWKMRRNVSWERLWKMMRKVSRERIWKMWRKVNWGKNMENEEKS